MKVYFSDILFDTTVMRAVLMTLIHSIWLGTIMALLAAIIVMLTKRSVPQLRYKLLSVLLILFVISTLYIFYSELIKEINGGEISKVVAIGSTTETPQPGSTQPQPGMFDTFTSLP